MTDETTREDMEKESPGGKHCPLLRQACLRDRCAWWMREWHEERSRYNVNCAVNLIAIGANDESLFRVMPRKSED